MLTICDNNVNSYAPSNWCSDTLKNIFRCSSRNLVKTRSYLLLERCEFLTDFGFHLKLKCVPILPLCSCLLLSSIFSGSSLILCFF